MGLLGILIGLGLLVWLAYRGWSVLGLAPLAALVAMGSAAGFIAQFFPLFLLGALFGKLMDDSGSVTTIANFMTHKLGPTRSVLAVVLAGALVTYGGVSLFVAMFVIAPMGQALFRAADIPNRLLPAAVALGTTTFTMTAMPGSSLPSRKPNHVNPRSRKLSARAKPGISARLTETAHAQPALAAAIQNAIPMPFFGTTPFAAPGLGIIGSAVMLGFGLWWLGRAEKRARTAGEGFGGPAEAPSNAATDTVVRERGSTATAFDPAEAAHGSAASAPPGIGVAMLPLVVVMAVNLTMSMIVLPRMDTDFLALPQWGETSLAGVGGVWSVIVALAAAIVVLYLINRQRLATLRETVDAGLNASVLPVISVASLVGFGAVVAAMPAFQVVTDWVLGIEGGPLVGLAVATNVLSALTGSASGGMTIALSALGETYMQLAATYGIDPALLHRVAAIGAGSLDSLPHNGAVVTLLAVCGATHKQSYFDIVMVGIVSALLALVTVIVLGSMFGSF